MFFTATLADSIFYCLVSFVKYIFVKILISLRIFLSPPETVSVEDRSFSKLNVVQNFTTSLCIGWQVTWWSVLAKLNELAKATDFDLNIRDFAVTKINV